MVQDGLERAYPALQAAVFTDYDVMDVLASSLRDAFVGESTDGA
jgi:hypothetical protein